MNRTVFSVLVLGVFGAASAQTELPPPSACPQCGAWDVNSAEPSGATGERISIGPESVDFPGCGRFRATTVKQSISEDADHRRRYRVTLDLQAVMADALCTVPDDAKMRMELEIGVGYSKDAGIASFSVYKPNQAKPVVTAQAWNFERDNPCDSGSGAGSAACMAISNARTYKMLAQEIYEAHANVRPVVSSRLARQLDVASFAASVFRFCLDREAGNGGGSWPYVWALSCQAERLDRKLTEVREWRACLNEASGKCNMPTNKFDRSKSEGE